MSSLAEKLAGAVSNPLISPLCPMSLLDPIYSLKYTHRRSERTSFHLYLPSCLEGGVTSHWRCIQHQLQHLSRVAKVRQCIDKCQTHVHPVQLWPGAEHVIRNGQDSIVVDGQVCHQRGCSRVEKTSWKAA